MLGPELNCFLKKRRTIYAFLVSQNSKLRYQMSVGRFDNTNFNNNTFCSMIHFILRIVRLRIVTLTVSSPFEPPENIRKLLVKFDFLMFSGAVGEGRGGQKETLGRKGLKDSWCSLEYLQTTYTSFFNPLTLPWRRLLSYRNQSIDLLDWFLYDNGLRNERVKRQFHKTVKHTQTIHREIANELFECVWPLCGTGA